MTRHARVPGCLARRSRASARSCGSRSPPSPRRRTRSRSRSRCGRTASTGRTCSTAWNDIHIDQYFWNTIVHRGGPGSSSCSSRTHRRLRALGAAPAVRADPERARRWRRCSSPASCCSCRCTSRSCTRRCIGGRALLNNYLAVWLPMAANAFNILLVKRFFDNLPARSSRLRRQMAPARSGCSGR